MSATRFNVSQRIRYRFEGLIARRGWPFFGALIGAFIVLLSAAALLRCAMVFARIDHPEQEDLSFLHSAFVTFLQMTDPGNMAYDLDAPIVFKTSAVISGLAGVVMLSALIAFLTTTLDQKINDLKKGHSDVVEHGHTLILGWNDHVVDIVRELTLANESQRDPSIVILAQEAKETMDDVLGIHLPDTRNTRVVTRCGAPSMTVNLKIASVSNCKSVIVLAECGEGAPLEERAASDAAVIKTILAVVATRPEGRRLNIVAEVMDPDNRDIVRGISPEEVTTVEGDDIVAKMIVQTSRSAGLSVVYNEIFGFAGSELYFYKDTWGRISFGDIAFRFRDGIPIGLRHSDGRISLNPKPETDVAAGDSALVLAKDDSTIEYLPSAVSQPRDLPLPNQRRALSLESVLIIGWTPKIGIILRQFADYVLEGSQVGLMLRDPSKDVRDELERLRKELPKLKLNLIANNPLSMEGLLAAGPLQYDNIILLSQSGKSINEEQTDSQTIVILLLLRKIFQALPEEVGSTQLITEVSRLNEQVNRLLQVGVGIGRGRVGDRQWFSVEQIGLGHVLQGRCQVLPGLVQRIAVSDRPREIQDGAQHDGLLEFVACFVGQHVSGPRLFVRPSPPRSLSFCPDDSAKARKSLLVVGFVENS